MDRKVIEVPVGYPTSSIFIDESRARAGGGRFFAVAAVKVRKPEALARSLHEIRDKGNGFKGEFKFKSVTTGTLPRYYEAVALLETPDAQVHACVVDTEVYDPFKKKDALFWKVHAEIVTQLLIGCINKRELVSVLIDKISVPKDAAYGDEVKARVNRRLGATAVVGCVSIDSRCHDVLQLADLVAGSIAYDLSQKDEKYKPKESDKKKVATHVKAALGGVDFSDGRRGRINIATYRAPARRRRAESKAGRAGLALVADRAG